MLVKYFFFVISAFISRISDRVSHYSQHGSETKMRKQQAETNLVKYLMNDHKQIFSTVVSCLILRDQVCTYTYLPSQQTFPYRADIG